MKKIKNDGFRKGLGIVFVSSLAVLILIIFPIQVLAAPSGDSLALQGDNEEGNGSVHTYIYMYVGHPTVTRIKLTLGEEYPNVDVDVEELEGRPAWAGEPPLLASSYISLKVFETVDGSMTDISKNIENAVIQFKVPRSWIERNRVDENTIVLLRLNGKWRELPTSLVRSTDIYLYFEATTPGFSVFAVAGQSAGVPLSPPLVLYAMLSVVAVSSGLSVFYWFRKRPMKSFVSLKRLSHAVMRRKSRLPEVSEPEMVATLRRLRRATELRPIAGPPVKKLGLARMRKEHRRRKDVKLLERLKRKMEMKK